MLDEIPLIFLLRVSTGLQSLNFAGTHIRCTCDTSYCQPTCLVDYTLRNGSLIKRCRRRPNFLESLIVGDEAAFAMNGEVCTHNVRQYAQKGHPPEFNFERNASREKLHIWAAIAATVSFWGLTFSIVMLPVLSTSGC